MKCLRRAAAAGAVMCIMRSAILAAPAGAAPAAGAPASGPFDVTEKNILELQAALDGGAVTSRDLVQAYLSRIDAYDRRGPALNAMIVINPRALEEAAELDRQRAARRRRSPLYGIPVVVKDNYDTVDLPTTAGSVALQGSMADRDAFQVRKLRDAGAVIVGKTNLHEFARGITTLSSLGGQTRNPYDPTRNPGGSSGGTGAAVAANYAAAGLGTDTCGSIRYPAAHNSLVGLRPTLGLSSRSGIVPLAHSQDVGGPLARTVTDIAVLLDATVGPDPDDPVTAGGVGHVPPSYRASLDRRGLRGARLGVLDSLFGQEPEDLRAGSVVRTAIRAMAREGAQVVDVSDLDVPAEADVSVIRYEFKFDLNEYLRRTPRAPVRSLADVLDRGTYLKALEQAFRRSNDIATLDTDEYRVARQRQAALRARLIQLLDSRRLTAVVYPTLRRTAAKIGEPQTGGNCAASAATGLPSVTVPAGFADDGMPVGVEFLGRPFGEPDLLRVAFSFEQATRLRRPPALTPPLR